MARVLIGTFVAITVLSLYAYSVVFSIMAALCLSRSGCQTYTPELNEGITTVLNLVGGLLAALVVAELAVTPTGEAPAARLLANNITENAKKIAGWVSIAYLVVWVILGVAVVVVGFLQHPNTVPALTAAARSWMGLAIAAIYSYLGINSG